MSYYGDDDYDYDRERRRRPSPHRYRSDYRRSAQFLNPNDGGGLYRTRSQGHGPVPVVNVYNDMLQRSDQSNASPPNAPYPPSPEQRGRRDRLGDDADLALENRRLRSRSRGRSDAGILNRRTDWYEYELRQKQRELDEMERRASIDRERERIEREYEMKKRNDEAKRRLDEDAAKEEKKRIIADYEDRKREESEDRKAEEKRIREKIEREKREAKEKEEREWKEFLRKQKEKEEEEKEKKREKEEEYEEEFRRRMSRQGFTYNQIENMLKDEKEKRTKTTIVTDTKITNSLTPWQGNKAPVYAKVHRDFLSIDTLTYYGIPWEYDRVSLTKFS